MVTRDKVEYLVELLVQVAVVGILVELVQVVLDFQEMVQ
jgi:hypothetical protein